ncbi:type II toxin-antitoxin system RatA family toxin [Streptomyces flavofungini]|uniref:type II toxin-antitoxin system RatA family toxin n=1 Tax=Streptomyces flavofungini TaxID=68200 RepID=UPI001E5A969D|nr:SRPBCC family protein [Streptomyces flavofungini]
MLVDLPNVSPSAGYAQVSDFARYPELASVVRTVTVHPLGDGQQKSDWEVYFRNGILRWTEADDFHPHEHRISFRQTDGDFDSFAGTWHIISSDTGCRVRFAADFDFGIPSMAGILDPVAERVIKETIARVVLGLFDNHGAVIGDPLLARAVTATALPVPGHVAQVP